jgi:hypothetical protein
METHRRRSRSQARWFSSFRIDMSLLIFTLPSERAVRLFNYRVLIARLESKARKKSFPHFHPARREKLWVLAVAEEAQTSLGIVITVMVEWISRQMMMMRCLPLR